MASIGSFHLVHEDLNSAGTGAGLQLDWEEERIWGPFSLLKLPLQVVAVSEGL